jgi:hypothetical protein
MAVNDAIRRTHTFVMDVALKFTGGGLQASAFLNGMFLWARGLMESEPVWVQIVALAEQLVQAKRLTGSQVRDICRTAIWAAARTDRPEPQPDLGAGPGPMDRKSSRS